MADKPSTRKWTNAQLAGITTTGSSLLVSAAAGSGKTAVLAERCAYLVCDAAPPCNIDQLLVVTFTENAAAEMKSRIAQALRDRAAQKTSPHLQRQLALIEHAQVSTLHGFCARLIRQHFHLLELDPNFTILDGDEAMLLQGEIAREMLDDRYELDDSGIFHHLIDVYGDGDDQRLRDRILDAHQMLCSVISPDAWRTHALQRIAEGAKFPLEKSELGRELLAIVDSRLTALAQLCGHAIGAITELKLFPKYVEQLRNLETVLAHWLEVLHENGLDALAEIVPDLQLPKLPSMSNLIPGKDLAKGWIDSVRDEIKDGAFRECLRFTSEHWRKGLANILPFAESLLGLVDEFSRRYEQAKRSARAVDFNDLERLALRVLRDGSKEGLVPSSAARLYHQQFQHVLVDEYQDINEVQDAILTLVSRECVAHEGTLDSNLFCVGDVKQSIYRFRLAEPGRFLERHRRFKQSPRENHGQVIDLQANFRSRGTLLDVLNDVFARLMTAEAAEIEYDKSHWLHTGLAYPDGPAECFPGAPIELHLLPKDVEPADDNDENEAGLDRTETEAILAARLINQMIGKDASPRRQIMQRGADGTLRPRDIRHGDIVILLRSLKYKADQYAAILRASGIPVHSASRTGYFSSIEVRDMLALLNLLDNQQQDIPLAAVLRSPLVQLDMPEDALARIRLAFRDKSIPFHQAVVRYANEKDDDLAARLKKFMDNLAGWREMAHRRPLAEVIWTLYEDTGYLAFCAGLYDGAQRCANLIHLHERARQFGTFQRQGLFRFLRFLQSLEEESDLGQPSIASEADDVVRIMSVHGSKGLEFPVVLLPDLGKKINLQGCSGSILIDRKAYLGLSVVDETRRVRYPSLASMMVQNRLRRQSMAEELRVLYVAMTRAREHLILLGTCRADAPEKWSSLWANRTGPLPADTVLGASTMLDWLGPVAATMPDKIRIIPHASEQIAQWTLRNETTDPRNVRQSHLAELKPLKPAPPFNPLASDILSRLAYTYPQQVFSNLSASQSITNWTKHGAATPAGNPDNTERPIPFERILPPPRCVLEDTRPSAVDRGTATHLVLQYLDFTRPCDSMDLAEQVNTLVTRRLIAPAHAAAVDFDAISWLMRDATGKLLRDNNKTLWRELPFYYAVPPQTFDGMPSSAIPLDQVMIRGRLDVLVPTSEGLIVIDYKTDRVTPQTLPTRAEMYRPQVERYREAVEKMTGQRVIGVHLIFLTPRLVWSL